MKEYAVILSAEDEYSSPTWICFGTPKGFLGTAHKERGEYSVTVLVESPDECKQMLNDWSIKHQLYVWR